MEFSYPTILVVPLGLGLLGFVEPCTVGAHLVFLRAIEGQARAVRMTSTLAFVLARTLTMGLFGAVIAVVGRLLITVQTTFWLVFGAVYLLIGLAYAFGRADAIKRPLRLIPRDWSATTNPIALGGAFGLGIPACAAPILFGLLGLAAGSNAAWLGFATMAVFGLALSVPLAAFAFSPMAATLAARLKSTGPATRWAFAAVFLGLGAWSIWFGLFVDPQAWSAL